VIANSTWIEFDILTEVQGSNTRIYDLSRSYKELWCFSHIVIRRRAGRAVVEEITRRTSGHWTFADMRNVLCVIPTWTSRCFMLVNGYPLLWNPMLVTVFTKARYYNLSEPVYSNSHAHKYLPEICFNIIPPSTRKFHLNSIHVSFRISIQTLFTLFQRVLPMRPLFILSSLLDEEHKLWSLSHMLFSVVSVLVMQLLNGLF
jgi:hypothetical protein